MQSAAMCLNEAVPSHCRVDADGVSAEWVEVGPAVPDQPTLVYFVESWDGPWTLERIRSSAGDLARVTGARVLTVACPATNSRAAAAGLVAYAWLLNEGTDVALTRLTDSTGLSLARAIQAAARDQSLPVAPLCTHADSERHRDDSRQFEDSGWREVLFGDAHAEVG